MFVGKWVAVTIFATSGVSEINLFLSGGQRTRSVGRVVQSLTDEGAHQYTISQCSGPPEWACRSMPEKDELIKWYDSLHYTTNIVPLSRRGNNKLSLYY